ncbi:FAD-dependent monooxygenase [Kitasatospora sp. NPDC089797]|uniref:NAD(P)/FAD-dependent oxidoreductase n=1 Tax=Kitasatospora sp. NPDC089797 TaxID=3155298 RepID=UPI00341AABA9
MTGRPRAVVVGAGIAGLLAARVLADACAEVEVLEQDVLPDRPAPRPGVPQGHHVHGLTARGADVMEALFPGLRAELTAAGAPGGDFGQIVAFRFPDCWSPRTRTGIPLQTFSRPLLEARLRRRVVALGNVRIRPGVRVTGLTGGAPRVRGVVVRSTPGQESAVDADLVVVANGRASQLPQWLTGLGLPGPRRTVIDAGVGYASRLYATGGADSPPWAAAMELLQAPHVRRGFMATRVEGDRLLVTLQGAAGDHPPHDPEGFAAFARGLRTPLAELLSGFEPLTSVRGYARCANQRTHYHRLPRWPDGLIVLGDAVCAFNPLYGQGMGVAAMAADLLRTMVQEAGAPGFGHTYQRRLARLTRRPWLMSTVQDRGWQQPRPDRTARLAGAVLPPVQRAMAAEPEVFRRFLEAMHMTRSSAVLLHPRALLPVLAAAVRPARTGPPDDPRLWWGHTPS